MNLRIPDPQALVELLHGVVVRHGTVTLSVDGWQVSELEGGLLYHRSDPKEVGGPYPTLGALLRDAGQRVGAAEEKAPDGEPVWEVRAWGGAYFAIQAHRAEAPTRHLDADAALAAASEGRAG